MATKRQKVDSVMITWLQQNFPPGKNYLVHQNDKEQINSFLADRIVMPFQIGRKHNLWGEIATKLPQIGKKLGWVPNKIPGTFLAETVERELADALAATESNFKPHTLHFENARNLLTQFNLLSISQQSPLSLSQGEMKLIWFLSQWVKKPEYLIIGYLPSGLSKTRIRNIIKFVTKKQDQTVNGPSVILGYQRSNTEWCNELFSDKNWRVIPHWLK